MRKVLLTGARGFLGQSCLSLLQAEGFEVHAVSSSGTTDPGSDVRWHQADLLDSDQVADLLADVEPSHLLHLAWYAARGRCWSSTENVRWIRASLNLLQSFTEQGGERVVMAGTCAEYD